MIEFIRNPNLPSGKVSSLICGSTDRDILNFFDKNKTAVLPCEPNIYIDSSVSTHADMCALHLGENRVIVDKAQLGLIRALEEYGMNVFRTKNKIEGNYPDDIKLNFAVVGNSVIGNFKFSDELTSEFLNKKRLINVKQGYCKCSVLVVNDNAVITDDESIFHSVLKNSFEALLIRKGDISLPGHEYGFIGGASGKISHNEVVFFGNIRKHRDYEAINTFLKKHGCDYVCTDSKALRDIGGIIPITQTV